MLPRRHCSFSVVADADHGLPHLARGSGNALRVFTRPWLPIDAWQEWRCVVHERRLVGVFPYWPHARLPRSVAPHAMNRMAETIVDLAARAREVLHVGSSLLDVIVAPDSRDDPRAWRASMLEINPLYPLHMELWPDPPTPRPRESPFRRQFFFRDARGVLHSIPLSQLGASGRER